MNGAPPGMQAPEPPPVSVAAPGPSVNGAGFRASGHTQRIALLGNPNTGKTTLFNRLSGLRHKVSNFPGTTLDARLGRVYVGAPVASLSSSSCCGEEGPAQTKRSKQADAGPEFELIDLPGIYSLELEQPESTICREVLAGETAPKGESVRAPNAACVVVDAANLGRNLMLAGEVLRRRLPTVIAVNMIDLARRRGLRIDPAALESRLGCGVVCISARTGEGLYQLKAALRTARIPSRTPPGDERGLLAWADETFSLAAAGSGPHTDHDDRLTDRVDHALTHPVLGLLIFAGAMTALFWVLFALARYPMGWIDLLFEHLGGLIKAWVPAGVIQDLLADGVLAGIGGTVVFLPQICLLFFLISLLEDTGYLARAAFLMDRVLRPFGLPGHSFVPLLSSHACALPGIMATRGIPDRRERLATILVAPFMTCSARLPVYVLVTTILFGNQPALAALAFVGCYALGIFAGVTSALIARRTVLRGRSRPMALELPTYKTPSIRTALVTTYDRGLMFIKKAGTNIMMICIALWWLGAYPKVAPPARSESLRQQAAHIETAPQDLPRAGAGDDTPSPESLRAEADRLQSAHAKAHSFIGRAGRAVQPVFAPLGYDWRLTVGVLTSFAAREVFVSTMAVVIAGEEKAEDQGVLDEIKNATRDDGVTPVFTRAASWSLLVFFVLAMQCLPTLAVTAKESGHIKWAALQLAWMSGIAYLAAMTVYQVMK
jgi:ferrous iron transport protein B